MKTQATTTVRTVVGAVEAEVEAEVGAGAGVEAVMRMGTLMGITVGAGGAAVGEEETMDRIGGSKSISPFAFRLKTLTLTLRTLSPSELNSSCSHSFCEVYL